MVDNIIGQTKEQATATEQAKTFFETLVKQAQATTHPVEPKWKSVLMLGGLILVPVTIIVFAYLMSRR